jgi:hypothetical protein
MHRVDPAVMKTVSRLAYRYLAPHSQAIVDAVSRMTPDGLYANYGIRCWPDFEAALDLEAANIERHVIPPIHTLGAGDTGDRHSGFFLNSSVKGEPEADSGGVLPVIVAIVGLISGIIGLIKGIVELEDLFNETDDDDARKWINNATCEQIIDKPNAQLVTAFEAMMNGPTGDDDEEAMLKVLKCLPSNRVQALVNALGGWETLADEFNGSEWNELMLRLQQCGVVNFAAWDDDTTRLFIQNSWPATLAILSIPDIVQLCQNLFSGSCGDDDEKAIIKLIKSQDPCKNTKIVTNHISLEEFDDNVDYSEWDDLCTILVTDMHACIMSGDFS